MKSATFGKIIAGLFILGVLAAIATPNFVSYRKRSYDAAANADVKNAYTALQAFHTDHPGAAATPQDLANYGFTPTRGVNLSLKQGPDGMVIASSHASGNRTYSVDSAGAITCDKGGLAEADWQAFPEAVPDRSVPENPDFVTDQFASVEENQFLLCADHPLSTFSLDVDTASYSIVRRMLENGSLPAPGAVRIEEMVNYFEYDYSDPEPGEPFSVRADLAPCPWAPGHSLLRLGVKAGSGGMEERPGANLVFLIDVSGSMDQPDKLPLVQKSMKALIDGLDSRDTVAIVTYAGSAGLAISATECTNRGRTSLRRAVDRLSAGGGTWGSGGIEAAYKEAARHFKEGGVNRVVLATDGDFNIGTTSQSELVELIQDKARSGIFLTVLGFGMGNLKDSTMELLADKGNGNYGYVDNLPEARKLLSHELWQTLWTVAKDVKVQVEWNPTKVGAYRLIGYENRMLADQDFTDDRKDAGEVGSGRCVTVLYELTPPGEAASARPVGELHFQESRSLSSAAYGPELALVKIRYKEPDGDVSSERSVAVADKVRDWDDSPDDFRFACAVAGFGMLLRKSEHSGNLSWNGVERMAGDSLGNDPFGLRREFMDLVRKAQRVELRS